MTTTPLSVFAPAKINLTLHVCGRRADGYHLLDSLVVFAGTGDWISVRRADDIRLDITGPYSQGLSGEGDNLVTRAARYLLAVTGRKEGAHITLEKNLPIASGIGGGSSDAAATLIALSQLWDENLAPLADADLAAKLGADVPVCLRRVPTFMRGIGELLAPAPDLPPAWLVLVNPNKPLATKAVFGALNGRTSAPQSEALYRGLPTAADLGRILSGGRNDLAAAAGEVMGEISEMLAALEGTPGCLLAQMSGSGPTCFGLYGDSQAAGAAAEALKSAQPGWWIAPAPLMSGA
ncbi:MAG: 4-(cytidine 5'-diphospho)-2-C-methyl-D-erythritol kinase [Rhodospirillaceae bacterium]